MSDCDGPGSGRARITPAGLNRLVTTEQYYRFPGTTLTVCCLTMTNGYYASGESACALPEDFDELTGRICAREKAMRTIWDLEAYRLRQRIYEEGDGLGPAQAGTDDDDLGEP